MGSRWATSQRLRSATSQAGVALRGRARTGALTASADPLDCFFWAGPEPSPDTLFSVKKQRSPGLVSSPVAQTACTTTKSDTPSSCAAQGVRTHETPLRCGTDRKLLPARAHQQRTPRRRSCHRQSSEKRTPSVRSGLSGARSPSDARPRRGQEETTGSRSRQSQQATQLIRHATVRAHRTRALFVRTQSPRCAQAPRQPVRMAW